MPKYFILFSFWPPLAHTNPKLGGGHFAKKKANNSMILLLVQAPSASPVFKFCRCCLCMYHKYTKEIPDHWHPIFVSSTFASSGWAIVNPFHPLPSSTHFTHLLSRWTRPRRFAEPRSGSVSLLRSSWYCPWDFAVRGNWVSSNLCRKDTGIALCLLLSVVKTG